MLPNTLVCFFLGEAWALRRVWGRGPAWARGQGQDLAERTFLLCPYGLCRNLSSGA